MTAQPTKVPDGTVTFLVSQVERVAANGWVHDVFEDTVRRHGGVMTAESAMPDGAVAAFTRASDALAAALQIQTGRAPDCAGAAPAMSVHTAEVGPEPERAGSAEAIARCTGLCTTAHEGQIVMSRPVHDLVIETLPPGAYLVDLGTRRIRDRSQPEQVWALAHPDLPGDQVGPGPGRVPNNLQGTHTSFIGRDGELADVRKLVAEGRLVTLTGTGGCGKSRLALHAVESIIDRFEDGIWWIELAALSDGSQIGAAIAEPFGVRPLPGVSDLQAVCAHLARLTALIVLDNCEHLLAAGGRAAEAVLQAAPNVRVLTTSRAPLGVEDEVAWRVPSLALPGPRELESTEAIAKTDAVALFVDRARGVRPNFSLTAANAAVIAQICHDVDGIPLAIELAAARVRILAVEQISSRLADRLGMLATGGGQMLERQQTLRASVDWSHDLLSTEEQTLLRRLSVFAGTFTLDAAEDVCAGDGIDRYALLDLLSSLVDHSLVIVEDHGVSARYRLLETIRQYALERLTAAGEQDALRDRHLDAFMKYGSRAAPHLRSADERTWLNSLDEDAANFAAAIEHAIATSPEKSLQFCEALNLWWMHRRPSAEVEAVYVRVLAATASDRSRLRAQVATNRAMITLARGEIEAGIEQATTALALAEACGSDLTIAMGLMSLNMSIAVREPAASRPGLLRAAEHALAADHLGIWADAIQFVALSYLFEDNHPLSSRYAKEAMAALPPGSDPSHFARTALIDGSIALLDGRLDEARATIVGAHEAGYGIPIIDAWLGAQVALLDIVAGRPDEALEPLRRQLDYALRTGAGLTVPPILTWLAWAEMATGDLEAAQARLKFTIGIVDGRDALLSLWSHWLLGETLRLLGDDGAQAVAEDTVALGELLGNRFAGTRSSVTLGRLAAGRGDWSEAERHVLAHLDVVVEGGHRSFVPCCIEALAEIAAGLASHEEAVRLLSAAQSARDELGVGRWVPETEHWERIEAGLRQSLGDEQFEAAWAIGQDLTIDEAIGWARRARGSRKRPPTGWESLTPTEAQVVELVAKGMTNPEVAERMFISRATVKSHLTHIFQKLEVRSRSELAARAAARQR